MFIFLTQLQFIGIYDKVYGETKISSLNYILGIIDRFKDSYIYIYIHISSNVSVSGILYFLIWILASAPQKIINKLIDRKYICSYFDNN